MSAPAEITQFVDALRVFLQRAGIEVALDGSEESLAYVDHYIDASTRGGKLAAPVVALVAPAIGAYLGQVALAKFGGEWHLETAEPATWRIDVAAADVHFYPVGMAAEALLREGAPGYDATFETRPGLTEFLSDALAAMPPVEESYYYSLTGRLETLTHVVDVLVDLKRQATPEVPEPDESPKN